MIILNYELSYLTINITMAVMIMTAEYSTEKAITMSLAVDMVSRK